jgi:hypothetical protein
MVQSSVLSYIDIFISLFLFCIPFILWSKKRKNQSCWCNVLNIKHKRQDQNDNFVYLYKTLTSKTKLFPLIM